MADILNQNGLSSGQLNAGSSTSGTPVQGSGGSRPSDVIPQAQKALTSIGMWQYPSDFPKYFMGFKIYRYSRDSLMSVALTDQLSTIGLPLPDQMIDVNQVAFEQVMFSGTIGNIADAAFKQVQQGAQNLNNAADAVDLAKRAGNQLWNAAKDSWGQVGAGLGVDATKALTGQTGMDLVRAAGYSPNYFLTVVMDGPRYKQYTCSWTMAPRNAKEAADLTQIIRIFKDAQSPGLTAAGALFTFPRVFMNYYGPNRGHLYQFKPSVLVNFTVNYSPAGMPSMKQAQPGTNGWNAPTAIRISATFLELEFWLRGDFGDTGSDANPNQDGANQIEPPRRSTSA